MIRSSRVAVTEPIRTHRPAGAGLFETRVTESTDPAALAGSIAKALRDGKDVELHVPGACYEKAFYAIGLAARFAERNGTRFRLTAPVVRRGEAVLRFEIERRRV